MLPLPLVNFWGTNGQSSFPFFFNLNHLDYTLDQVELLQPTPITRMQIILMFSHKLGLTCKRIHIWEKQIPKNWACALNISEKLKNANHQFNQLTPRSIHLICCCASTISPEDKKNQSSITGKAHEKKMPSIPRAQWRVKTMGSGFKSCICLLSLMWPLHITSSFCTSVSLPGKGI